jgi:hypothetical protein
MGILEVGWARHLVSDSNSKYLAKTLQWGLLLDRKKVQDPDRDPADAGVSNGLSAAQRADETHLLEIEQTIQGMRKCLTSLRGILNSTSNSIWR